MKRQVISLFVLLLSVGSAMAQDRLYADEFPLGDVKLLDGPLKKARDLNIKTLLQYDCDRLLAPYLKEAGLTPKGKSYPNWDGLGLDGVGAVLFNAFFEIFVHGKSVSVGRRRAGKRRVYTRAGACQENNARVGA